MAYACSNCVVEFDNPKSLVDHMVEKHDSPFLDGSPKLVDLSVARVTAEKDAGKKSKYVEKFANHGRVI